MAKYLRGIEGRHEQRQQELIRDTRTFGKKTFEFLTSPVGGAVAQGMCAGVAITLPALADIALAFSIISFLISFFHKTTLPFRLPMSSRRLDYNDPNPGTGKARMAGGIAFFGNDLRTNEELWFSNEDMRTHVLIFGSTGSGKTEMLLGIAYNAFIQGSGFIYVDGKGDNSLFAKVYAMARFSGREDDLLLINFMTGARDVIGAQKNRLSNTMNPFAVGSADMLAQLVISLMETGSKQSAGNDDMWKGRAISFVEALMRCLVYMRDQGHILLDAHTIRKYFVLSKLESIVLDRKFPVGDRYVDMSDAPEIATDPLSNYLDTLPGFQPAKKYKQSGECLEQHGFITMQLTRTFNSLADTYGHILRTNLAEVDFHDVILNRRILVVLLPALEKAPAELANLGKLIVASLKAMMAAGLGSQVEGTYSDVIERKPTNSETPYLCILDEYGYYAVDGFAVVPAQARSLGFSAVFAGQDFPAFQKASKEEAASIGANTNIKICMKLEDPTDTLEFFVKTAGEAYVTVTAGFQTKPSNFTNNYLDNQSAQVEKRNRIELLDLKDQMPGEFHLFFKSKIIRARTFYVNPPKVKYLQLNQFLKVETPPDEILIQISNQMESFRKVVDAPNFNVLNFKEDPELNFIFTAINQRNSSDYLNNAAHAIQNLYLSHLKEEEYLFDQELPAADLDGAIDIFSGKSLDLFDDPLKLLEIDPILINPIINKSSMLKNMTLLEHVCGSSKKDGHEITSRQIDEISKATVYPPPVRTLPDKQTVLDSFDKLIKSFKGLLQ
ncbi:MAG: TraM recognition domain-containing protein [Gammaproteobacteria bacterium]|nr:TraM recognition domain-containing protein [Gammaproteobacteria bacterium]